MLFLLNAFGIGVSCRNLYSFVVCLLLFTCNYVVSVLRGFLFLWVLGMGYVILLWHSLSIPLIILTDHQHIYGCIKYLKKLSSFNIELSALRKNLLSVERLEYHVLVCIRKRLKISYFADFNIRNIPIF